jgi:hypothetical protein
MDLDQMVKEHRGNLAAAALALKESTEFDLETPCALVAEGTVVTTTLVGLRNYLRCSSALSSEAIQRFVLLRSEHGFDKAFELCSRDDATGEEFVQAWDESQSDLAEGVVVTVNDLVAMVEQARKGCLDTDRRMLVVAREGKKVLSGTVPVDWVLLGS